MKKYTKNLFMAIAILAIASSCGKDPIEELLKVTSTTFDARLNNNPTAAFDSLTATVYLKDITDGNVSMLLNFTSTEGKMKRLYFTRNIQGQGDQKIDANVLFPGIDTKADGSLDLGTKSAKEFKAEFKFSTTTIDTGDFPKEGTIVYKFWATTKKGDFRDATKNNALGDKSPVAVLTMEISKDNPAAALKETKGIKLSTALADATSSTFISTFNCKTYKIKSGTTDAENQEFAELWDFGYFYKTNATLQSPVVYPSVFKDASKGEELSVFTFLGLSATDVNKSYFVKAASSVDFAAIKTAGALKTAAASVTASSPQKIENLAEGDVVFVKNQYGKNAILKVTAIVPGFGTSGAITFDLKVEL